MAATTVHGLIIRPVRAADSSRVLQLINADRLPGQPVATAEMLADAVAGRSAVDAGWWAELDQPAVDVLVDQADELVGVVSYATRSRDNAGLVLWLHGREQPEIIRALLDHALVELRGCSFVNAFDFATPLGLGLEALPVRHRPITAKALTDRGFVARDLWRYMLRNLPAPELPRAESAQVAVRDCKHHLEVRDGDTVLGEATVSVPMAPIGVLWWVSVAEAARGRGLGRRLLGSALQLLTDLGADTVILYVDDDAAPDDPERGRGAANALYDSAGFIEIDRLHSFHRPAAPSQG